MNKSFVLLISLFIEISLQAPINPTKVEEVTNSILNYIGTEKAEGVKPEIILNDLTADINNRVTPASARKKLFSSIEKQLNTRFGIKSELEFKDNDIVISSIAPDEAAGLISRIVDAIKRFVNKLTGNSNTGLSGLEGSFINRSGEGLSELSKKYGEKQQQIKSFLDKISHFKAKFKAGKVSSSGSSKISIPSGNLDDMSNESGLGINFSDDPNALNELSDYISESGEFLNNPLSDVDLV